MLDSPIIENNRFHITVSYEIVKLPNIYLKLDYQLKYNFSSKQYLKEDMHKYS